MIKLNVLRLIVERLDNGSICSSYITSSHQVANVLAKRLLIQNFDFCVSKLGLSDIYVPTSGGVLEIVDFGLDESPWVVKIYFNLMFYSFN